MEVWLTGYSGAVEIPDPFRSKDLVINAISIQNEAFASDVLFNLAMI